MSAFYNHGNEQQPQCEAMVSSSLISPLPQIQPSEGAAAQTPLAANTGVLTRAGGFQAGIGIGDECSRGHCAGGHSSACAPCVRHR